MIEAATPQGGVHWHIVHLTLIEAELFMLPLFAFVQEIRCLRLMLLFLLFYQYKEICDSYQYNVMINSWTQLNTVNNLWLHKKYKDIMFIIIITHQQSKSVLNQYRHRWNKYSIENTFHVHPFRERVITCSQLNGWASVFSHNERVEGVDWLSELHKEYIHSILS